MKLERKSYPKNMQKNLSLIYCLTEMIYSFWFPVASLRFCNTMQQFKPRTLKVIIRAILSRLSQKYSFHSLDELIPKKGIFRRSGDHHTHHPEPKCYIITAIIGILPNFFRIVAISLYHSLWRVKRAFSICNKRPLKIFEFITFHPVPKDKFRFQEGDTDCIEFF